MNFDLSDEQRLLQSTLDGLARKRVPDSPAYASSSTATTDARSRGLWKATGRARRARYPDAPRGAGRARGLELLDLVCVAERLGYHATPGPLPRATPWRGSPSSLRAARPRRSAWLPRLASRRGCIGQRSPSPRASRALAARGLVAGARVSSSSTLSGRRGARALRARVPHRCSSWERRRRWPRAGRGPRAGANRDRAAPTASIAPGVSRQRERSKTRPARCCRAVSRLRSGRLRDAGLAYCSRRTPTVAPARCVELAVAYANQREQFGRRPSATSRL